MSTVLEFLPEAKCDAEEATRYYEKCIPGLGARFRKEVENVCSAITNQALLWRERPGGYRQVNIPGFPYYVAYIIRDHRILVAAVGHASRHPDYWKKREAQPPSSASPARNSTSVSTSWPVMKPATSPNKTKID